MSLATTSLTPLASSCTLPQRPQLLQLLMPHAVLSLRAMHLCKCIAHVWPARWSRWWARCMKLCWMYQWLYGTEVSSGPWPWPACAHCARALAAQQCAAQLPLLLYARRHACQELSAVWQSISPVALAAGRLVCPPWPSHCYCCCLLRCSAAAAAATCRAIALAALPALDAATCGALRASFASCMLRLQHICHTQHPACSTNRRHRDTILLLHAGRCHLQQLQALLCLCACDHVGIDVAFDYVPQYLAHPSKHVPMQ